MIEFDGATFAVKRRAPRLEKREPDWEFVVSLMRNCSSARRDVGVLMSQIAFYKAQDKRREEQERLRNKWNLERWKRQTK